MAPLEALSASGESTHSATFLTIGAKNYGGGRPGPAWGGGSDSFRWRTEILPGDRGLPRGTAALYDDGNMPNQAGAVAADLLLNNGRGGVQVDVLVTNDKALQRHAPVPALSVGDFLALYVDAD